MNNVKLEKPPGAAPVIGSELDSLKYQITMLEHNLKKAIERLNETEENLARQKRYLSDMLYNLDDDNMGLAFLSEKKAMKDKDIELQSRIEQTAGSITMQVRKEFKSDAVICYYNNPVPPYYPLQEDLDKVLNFKEYLWCNEHFPYPNESESRYYFWSPILDGWAYLNNTAVVSMFQQIAEGFLLRGDVKIDGNLITRGKIFAGDATKDEWKAAPDGSIHGAEIYSPHIVGCEYKDYGSSGAGVFAEIAPRGIKIMQGNLQKIGMTVNNQGHPILVIGAGEGGGSTFNGVLLSPGMFVIEKSPSATSVHLYGSESGMTFSPSELQIFGNYVTVGYSPDKVSVGGIPVSNLATRSFVAAQLSQLWADVQALVGSSGGGGGGE